jgi:hypothetical protein
MLLILCLPIVFVGFALTAIAVGLYAGYELFVDFMTYLGD